MAADGKLQAEIERMFFLVGILQDRSTVMATKLSTLNPKISNTADCVEDLLEKNPAAELEETSLEPEEREEGVEKIQAESTNQKFTSVEYKEEDLWIMNLLEMGEGAPGISEIFGLKRNKKYDWGLSLGCGKQVGRYLDFIVPELLRDLMININDYQQTQWREMDRDLRASDVRNPG